MPDQDSGANENPRKVNTEGFFDGAFGAGLVLVALPCAALFYVIKEADKLPSVGLPILTIFGVMILFGALALVSTLFARLELSDRSQALALPEGSIRAAIALALIVLFAIISIMLYQSSSKPEVIEIKGLSEAAMSGMTQNPANRVVAIVPDSCAKPSPPDEDCKDKRFTIHIRLAPAQEATDLAKQLLILIGTLMTSVTSFYFASRANEPKPKSESPEPALHDNNDAARITKPVTRATGRTSDESHMDACEVPIVTATPDEELPPAKGGVA